MKTDNDRRAKNLTHVTALGKDSGCEGPDVKVFQLTHARFQALMTGNRREV